MFNEKVKVIPTGHDLNFLTVETFQEVFFDVFEITINKNTFIAEKVSEYKGMPVVIIPITYLNKKYDASFVLKEGAFEVLFNPKTLTYTGEVPAESVVVEEIIQDIIECKDTSIDDFIIEKRDDIINDINQAKLSATKYAEAIKQQKISEASLDIEAKQVRIKNEIAELKQDLLNEFYSLTENVRSDLNESNSIERNNVLDFINNSLTKLSDKLISDVTSHRADAIELFDEKIKQLANNILKVNLLKEIEHNQVSNLQSIDEKFKAVTEVLNTFILKEQAQVVDTVTNIVNNKLEEYDASLITLEKVNVEINESIKTLNIAFNESNNALDTLISNRIDVATSNIHDFYDNKIQLIEANVTDITAAQKQEFISLINESKQSLLAQIAEIKIQPNQILIEQKGSKPIDLKDVKKDLEKEITNKFTSELVNLKRYIELSSGGGSVAQQFANGGTMNGNLVVTGTLSASQYLGITQGGGGVSGDYLPLSGGTVNGNLTVVGTLCATLLEALSANITVLDIKQYELSGFNVQGNATVQGTVSANNTIYGNSFTVPANGIINSSEVNGGYIQFVDNLTTTFHNGQVGVSRDDGFICKDSRGYSWNDGLRTGDIALRRLNTNTLVIGNRFATETRSLAVSSLSATGNITVAGSSIIWPGVSVQNVPCSITRAADDTLAVTAGLGSGKNISIGGNGYGLTLYNYQIKLNTFLKDVYLSNDDNHILALRAAGNPQALRLYNTYTNDTTFERLNLQWQSSVFKFGTEKGSDGGLARSMEFQTDGTTRMNITTAGNIGIVTTTPSNLLHIDCTLNKGILLTNSTQAPNRANFYINAGQPGAYNAFNIMESYDSVLYGILVTYQRSIYLGGFSNAVSPASVTVLNDQYKLDLLHLRQGPIGSSTVFKVASSGDTTIYGTVSAIRYLGLQDSLSGNPVLIGGNSTGTDLLIGTNDNYALNLETAGSTKMTVTSAGTVGIGTTTPLAILDVSSNGDTSLAQIALGKINHAGSIRFRRGSDGASTGYIGYSTLDNGAGFSIYAGGGTGAITMQAAAGPVLVYAGNVNPTIFAANGSLGINTLTPTAKLDVVDTTLASSGGLSGSVLNLTQTWNTSGAPTAITLNVTNSASGAASNLMDLQVGGSSMLKVDKSGNTTIAGALYAHGGSSVLTTAYLQLGNSAGRINFNSNIIHVQTATGLGWFDLPLWRDAANTLAQRNGINPQSFRLYNTYTDTVSAFERLNIKWDANVLKLGTEKGSTGGLGRAIELQTDGTTRMTITSAGRVGIGITAPSLYDLTIQNADTSAYSSIGILKHSNSNTNGRSALTFGGDFGNSFRISQNGYTTTGENTPNHAAFLELYNQNGMFIGTGQVPNLYAQFTTAQEKRFSIYSALNSLLTNYERLSFKPQLTGSFLIMSEALGTGAYRDIEIQNGGSTRMAITSAGNIGIGTTAPNQRLTVTGNISATGIVYGDGSGLTNVGGSSPYTTGGGSFSITTVLGSNTASGYFASINGGSVNTASGYYSVINGGIFNTASGYNSTINSGRANTACGTQSIVNSGDTNTASGYRSAVINGRCNTASGACSTVSNGFSSRASAPHSTISNGNTNTASGIYSTVLNGNLNIASGYRTTVINGRCNTASGATSTTVSGIYNTASGYMSLVGNGGYNTASGYYSTTVSGLYNTASGIHSTIINGTNNIACLDNTYILGSGITTDKPNTTYVESLQVMTTGYLYMRDTATLAYRCVAITNGAFVIV